MNAEEITRSLGGRWFGRYGTARCPAHDDTSPSLSLSDAEDGKLLAKCHGGCEFTAVVAALRNRGLGNHGDRADSPAHANSQRRAKRAVEDEQRRIDHARSIWIRAVPILDTPAEAYLRARGLRGPFPPTLRFLAAAKHGPTGLLMPAMIAAVTRWPGRDVVAIHRTFLLPDGRGKAPVTPDKAMLAPVGGGAVRLAPAAEVMAVAEGIETALSVQESSSLATWAALSAGGIEKLQIPDMPLAADICIAADNDPPGLQAAEKAAARWTKEGRKVRIAKPSRPGADFNDLLQEDCEARDVA